MCLLKFFKRKSKMTKEEVAKAIIQLQNQLDQIEDRLDSITEERKQLFRQGKATQDQRKRLYLGKKIRYYDQEMKDKENQAMMILYNIQLANQLKLAIENQNFIESIGAVNVNKMLNNPKELASFLNKALNRRVNHETMLTEADDVFKQVKSQYTENDQIYGINESDDEILAQFEQEDIMDIETQKATADEQREESEKMKGM